jgi:hypothetical protein
MAKVIFDTNAYRNLVTGKTFEEIDGLISDIKAREAVNDIQTLLSPIVVQELLAHLADKNDSAFEKCLKANKALYLHNGNPQTANVFPTFEVLLAQMYFHAVPQKRIDRYNALLQMSYHLAVNPNEANFTIFENNLLTIKASVEFGEQGFVDGMLAFVKQADPSAADWMPFRNDKAKRAKLLTGVRSNEASRQIAAGYVFLTELMLNESGHNIQLSPDQINQISDSVVTTFPEPIALFKSVIENLANSEFPLDEASRANFVWDIALMFGVGKHNMINDKLYFVTADKAIIRTAIQQGSGTSVLSLDDYLEYINN